eukprot:TRINITY_DN5810_c0_g1_i1.p1 TRINITY_DN5810_c0_g1~~TRINITY_DN5810_c0_g1_i1.p1  ORF type:complete len:106 (+),score=31.24 TRINITY_DN5810_c0_g1_i1:199-516(+)
MSFLVKHGSQSSGGGGVDTGGKFKKMGASHAARHPHINNTVKVHGAHDMPSTSKKAVKQQLQGKQVGHHQTGKHEGVGMHHAHISGGKYSFTAPGWWETYKSPKW